MKIGDAVNKAVPKLVFREDPSLVLPTDYFGMEFEYEQVHVLPTEVIERYFQTEDDGSLRDNGLEYIFQIPLFGKDLTDAIRAICYFARTNNFATTYRTSTHVHMDVRGMDTSEVFRLLILYALYEKALFAFVGEGREDSNFCVPWGRSQMYFSYFKALKSEDKNVLVRTLARMERYSAVNLAAIREHGSIEFRQMHGTKDEAKVIEWLNLLMCLKKAAIESKVFDEYEILTNLSDLGTKKYTEALFGKWANLLDHRLVWDNVPLAQALLAITRDAGDFVNPLLATRTRTNGPLIDKFLENKAARP